MQRAPIEVVIVAYGSVTLLQSAVNGLGSRFRVHIIDNGASDDARRLSETHGYDYLRPPCNIGFAAAVNMGLARASRDADVLLLNPDAQIQPPAVLRLQDALRADPRLAAVAPQLLRPNGSLEPTRWPLPTPALPWRGIFGRGAVRRRDQFFVSGAVLLLSSESLRDVGGFDERYFLYAEETDWQKRAFEEGYSVAEVPEVHALHLGGATSRDTTIRDRYFHGSAELYIRKWYGPRGWGVFRAGSFLAAMRRAVTPLSGVQRAGARRTMALYVRGPARMLPPRPNR